MTWGNPPKFKSSVVKPTKSITPENMAGASEGSQQKALMVWAALAYAKYPQLKWLVHIPNGGTRNIREAVELKAQGVKAGVPDLMLAYPSPKYPPESEIWWNGLFIELKVKPNKVSAEQIAWLDNLMLNGYYVKVCYNWEEARDTLIAYLEGKL